jgi:hypothetical protein
MIANSRAWFILPFLALAPLRLQADATNAAPAQPAPPTPPDAAAVDAIAGYVSPVAPDDLCDWSEGHTITSPGVPPPTPAEHAKLIKSLLLKLAARLVDDQQKTPDPQIKTIIDQFHLGDTKALAALPPKQSQQTLLLTAFALIQAAKTDPLAAQVTNEFQITDKPSPAPAPAPATNAPSAVST